MSDTTVQDELVPVPVVKQEEEEKTAAGEKEKQALQALYLVVYNRPLFKAHWALFVPQDTGLDKGRLIHATGDVLEGFRVTFYRQYNLTETHRQHTSTFLGYINPEHVDNVAAMAGGNRIEDYVAHDHLEALAASVPAPGPSLRSVDSSGSASGSSSGGRPTRVEIKDCQTWLTDFIKLLVEQGILHPEALDVLNSAPRH